MRFYCFDGKTIQIQGIPAQLPLFFHIFFCRRKMPPIMEQGRYNQDDLYAQWNDPWATQPSNKNKQGHHSWRQQLASADRSDPYAANHNFPSQQYPQLPPPPPHLQHQHASGYYDSYYVTNNFAG